MKPDKNGLYSRFIDTEDSDHYISDKPAGMKVLKELEPFIGNVLVNFSVLEHTLEKALSGLLDSRSPEKGMLITKGLDYSDKVNLFNEFAYTYLLEINSSRINQLKAITKSLNSAGEVRNLVAHAKWLTLTEDGFVRCNIKLNTENGRAKVKYFKLDKEALAEAISNIIDADDELASFSNRLGLF